MIIFIHPSFLLVKVFLLVCCIILVVSSIAPVSNVIGSLIENSNPTATNQSESVHSCVQNAWHVDVDTVRRVSNDSPSQLTPRHLRGQAEDAAGGIAQPGDICQRTVRVHWIGEHLRGTVFGFAVFAVVTQGDLPPFFPDGKNGFIVYRER